MSDDGWQQLDRRTVWVSAVILAGLAVGAGVPTTTGVVGGGGSLWITLAFVIPGAILLIVGGTVADYFRWYKTSYRVTDTNVELRTGFFQRKHRSVHRDRVRTVDLSAHPIHRIFGVTKVSIGTGEHAGSDGSQLTLDPLSRSVAHELRRELLHRPKRTVDDDAQPVLARIDWRWLRFAPFSVWPGVLGVAVTGGAWQVGEWFGLRDSIIGEAGTLIRENSLWLLIPVALVIMLVVGLLATVALYVESWWAYDLQRVPGPTLQARRGLFVRRSLSLAEDRLRGIELIEPFGARLLGAGRLEAVATGIKKNKQDQKTEASKVLLPEAPRAHTDSVAADILREPRTPTAAALASHPRAALRRRLTWAFAAVAAVCGVLVIIGAPTTDVLLHIAWIAALVLTPFAAFAAVQCYRNLGHGSTGDYTVIRSGIVARRTAALRRDGIIGWTFRQTPWQRRSGLLTVTATTAANNGAYSARDADAVEAVQFADDMVPGLLTPFLQRR